MTDDVDYRQTVLDDGPVGYWRLGEASGTNANDETANNKDGTYNGSPPLGAAGAVGDGDTAVTIAVGDNVNMGDEFDFANTVSFTFEAWIYPTTIDTTYHRIVSKKDPNDPNGSQGWVIWVHDLAPGYQLGFQRYLDGANQAVLVSNVEIELNEWSHLMATFDGTDMKLYLNGVLIKTQTYESALSMTGNTEDFKLGESANGGSNFIGRIDEAAVYDKALEAGVARQRYRDGLRSDVAATYEYDVFGEVSDSTGTLANFFDFAGEQSDSSTGLQYLRARYYDTASGRFISQDPIVGIAGDPRSQNRYLYVLNNPVNLVDPSGNVPTTTPAGGPKEGTVSEVLGIFGCGGVGAGGASIFGGYEFGPGSTGCGGGGGGSVKPPITIKTVHSVPHMTKAGLTAATKSIEASIRGSIRSNAASIPAAGGFRGQIKLNGITIEYRGFVLPNGSISVGSYYAKGFF